MSNFSASSSVNRSAQIQSGVAHFSETKLDTKFTEKLDRSPKSQVILNGAMTEFLSHGYAATSMDRVAATAGVSKATVYSHFTDKEGLFVALIQNMAHQKFGYIIATHGGENSTSLPPARSREELRSVLMDVAHQIVGDENNQAFVRLIVGESARFPNLARLFVEHLSHPGLEMMAQYLQDSPIVQTSDPVASARIVVGTIVHYTIIQKILGGDAVMTLELERVVEAIVAAMCGSAL